MTRLRHAGRWPAVLALLAAAPPVDAAGLLALRAEPAALRLGTDRSAALVVEMDPGDVPSGAAPTFTASAGRVVDVRPLAPGRFAATYLPPAEAFPQVAIVAVTANARAGFVALPLAGRGVAVARARPGAAIRVTIGDASFGPVTAGPNGEARIPVVAPPGVRFALQGDQPLDLAIPDTAHVHVAADRDEAAADADQDVRVWAFAVRPDGSPRAGAPVELTPSHGWVGRLEEVAPGAFTGVWRLPAGAAAPASATARLRDEPVASAPLAVRRPAGPASRILLEAGGRRAIAGQAEAVPVTIRLEDAAGNPVEGAPRLTASRGALSAPARTRPGAWEASWAAPTAVGPATELVARAAGLEARLAIETVGGEAARLVVEAAAPRVVADGRAEVAVRIQLLDRFGNPAEGAAAPAVVAALPATVAAEPAGAAAWQVRYRPARARDDDVERLLVRAGPLEGEARIDVVAPARRFSVAPKLGLVASTAGARSAWLAAEAAWRLPAVGGRPALAAELGTFGHDRTDVVSVDGAPVEVAGASRWITAVASARWCQPAGGRWVLWGDAGAGLAWVSAQVRAGSTPTSAETDVVSALHAGVGAGVRIGHGTPFVEAGFTRFGAPDVERLRGHLSILSLSIGYRYDAY